MYLITTASGNNFFQKDECKVDDYVTYVYSDGKFLREKVASCVKKEYLEQSEEMSYSDKPSDPLTELANHATQAAPNADNGEL